MYVKQEPEWRKSFVLRAYVHSFGLCSFYLSGTGGVSGFSLTSPGLLSQTPEVFFINSFSFNHSYFLLVLPLLPVQKLGFPHMYLIMRFSRLQLLFSGKIEMAEVVESYCLLKTLLPCKNEIIKNCFFSKLVFQSFAYVFAYISW